MVVCLFLLPAGEVGKVNNESLFMRSFRMARDGLWLQSSSQEKQQSSLIPKFEDGEAIRRIGKMEEVGLGRVIRKLLVVVLDLSIAPATHVLRILWLQLSCFEVRVFTRRPIKSYVLY